MVAGQAEEYLAGCDGTDFLHLDPVVSEVECSHLHVPSLFLGQADCSFSFSQVNSNPTDGGALERSEGMHFHVRPRS